MAYLALLDLPTWENYNILILSFSVIKVAPSSNDCFTRLWAAVPSHWQQEPNISGWILFLSRTRSERTWGTSADRRTHYPRTIRLFWNDTVPARKTVQSEIKIRFISSNGSSFRSYKCISISHMIYTTTRIFSSYTLAIASSKTRFSGAILSVYTSQISSWSGITTLMSRKGIASTSPPLSRWQCFPHWYTTYKKLFN